MIKELLIFLWLSCLCWNHSAAQVSGVSDFMVENALANLKNLTPPKGGAARAKYIYDSTLQQANTCPNSECAYERYVSGIYKLVEHLGKNRRCPITHKDLRGSWANSSKWGHYKTISLSLYKGRPSVHQFMVFEKSNISDLGDGFGGWRFRGCEVKTVEHTSSSGRIFNPGNDLVIISYDRESKVLVVLDGDYVVSYAKQK